MPHEIRLIGFICAKGPRCRLAATIVLSIAFAPSLASCQSPLTDSIVSPPSVPSAIASDETPDSANASNTINVLLTRLILDSIPHRFEETKDWGGQSERWDGIKFHRDGLNLKTHRRKKMVNHGTWEKYSVELRDPDDKFSVQMRNMHETEDESLAFEISIGADLKITARQSQWVKGVQLYSLSAEGHAQVQLNVAVELGVTMDPTSFPPDLILAPVVTHADLILEDFRLDRISKAGGEFAQQVSKRVRAKLDQKIADRNDKLIKKINSRLVKQKDKMRLSLADAIQSKWSKAANPFLPPPVQQAIASDQ